MVQEAVKKPISVHKPLSEKSSTTNETTQTCNEQPVDEVTYKTIKTRRGQPAFRKALLTIFEGRCCITGCLVEGVLEAAHIVPHTTETNYSVTNGLLLRADIHTLYDLNLIGINGDGKVFVSSALKDSQYSEYHGQTISDNIPDNMKKIANKFSWQDKPRCALGRDDSVSVIGKSRHQI